MDISEEGERDRDAGDIVRMRLVRMSMPLLAVLMIVCRL